MRKATAQYCKQMAHELAEHKGFPYTKRFYRNIKKAYNTVPRNLKKFYTIEIGIRGFNVVF